MNRIIFSSVDYDRETCLTLTQSGTRGQFVDVQVGGQESRILMRDLIAVADVARPGLLAAEKVLAQGISQA